jgi:hypothetical protein
MLLSRPHGDALPPSGEQRAQVLRLRVGHWAGCGAHRLGKVRQSTGVEGLGFRSRPGGLGKIADLPGGDDSHG